jgi:HSP20 family protein
MVYGTIRNIEQRRSKAMAILALDPDVDPIGALVNLQGELERFMRNPAFGTGLSGYGVFPPINIFDSIEGAVVVAELPGLDASKIVVAGEGRTLTISGEREFAPDVDGRGYHRRELNEGRFSRSIQLLDDYDINRAEARYEAGLLVVRVPIAERAKPRQIAVQGA